MPSRPTFKQEDSFGPSDNVFELQSYGDKTEATKAGEKYTETTLVEDHGENYKGSTAHDQRDMDRLGKKQELRVSHRNQLYPLETTNTTLQRRETFASFRFLATHCS